MERREPIEIDGWPVISVYTEEQAVEDGVLVPVGYAGDLSVYFTGNLMAEGYTDREKRTDLVKQGLDLLRQPDEEDTEYMRLRVIEVDKAWVIQEPGK